MRGKEGVDYMKSIIHLLIGIVISFTIEILVMTIAVVITGGTTLPVSLIMQGFALAVCCSLIGTIFSSERLDFRIQTVLTYMFSLFILLLFTVMFRWYESGSGILQGKSFFGLVILLFTIGYGATMFLRWKQQKRNTKIFNEKLLDFKESFKQLER
jgi:hypothetical protein